MYMYIMPFLAASSFAYNTESPSPTNLKVTKVVADAHAATETLARFPMYVQHLHNNPFTCILSLEMYIKPYYVYISGKLDLYICIYIKCVTYVYMCM